MADDDQDALDDELLSLRIAVQNTRRKDVLLAFPDDSTQVITPSEIATKTEMHPSNVSRNLTKLKEDNLVRELDSTSSRYHPYVITKTGVLIRDQIQSEN